MFLKPIWPEWDELEPETRDVLFKQVRDFVRSGTVLSAREWADLPPVEAQLILLIRSGILDKELLALNALADEIEHRVAKGPIGEAKP